MESLENRSNYHSRLCALRNVKTAVIFLLFCVLQAWMGWREIGESVAPAGQSLIFYIAEIAVIAALVDFIVALKCLRERLVLGLAIFSFLLGLVGSLAPRALSAIPSASVKDLQFLLWLAASLVSVTLVYSAFRAAGYFLRGKRKG